jgi:tetratricopeptide (TPR) repeat protein
MGRSSVTIIVVFILAGFLFGLRLPHVLERQYQRVLANRPGTGITPEGIDFSTDVGMNSDVFPALQEELAHESDLWCDQLFDRIAFPNTARLEAMDNAQLYARSGLDERYGIYIKSVEIYSAPGLHNNLRAGRLLSKALAIRSSSKYHREMEEQEIADDLWTLGRYAEANAVIKSLDALPPTYKPYLRPRKILLIQTYVSLRNYKSALAELRALPEIGQNEYECLRDDSDYLRACSYMGAGDNDSAFRLFRNLAQWGWNDIDIELPRMYEKITRLAPNDHCGAKQIAIALEAHWSRAQACYLNCPEIVPELEFVADCMKSRGHTEAALELSRHACQIKCETADSRR